MPHKIKKIISIFLCFCFLFNQTGLAQTAGSELNLSGFFQGLTRQASQDKFRPLHLRYLSYNNLDNSFRLLLDKGSSGESQKPEELKARTKKLMDYFLIGLALPNEAFWVNLRPDAEDNIIDNSLEQTDIGRVLLEADVQLKKDTALATSPATPEGRTYWDSLYKKAEELFGYDSITIPTLTRPWIVPNEIIIRESSDNAYIYKATLKVCLEEDYLDDTRTPGHQDTSIYNFKDPRLKELNEYSSQLIRELIIPKLTKEINVSKRYAALRQVYYSLILSQWFKTRFSSGRDKYSFLINRKNLRGLTSTTAWSKDTYFKAYQDSFKQGEYNLKEPHQTPFGQTIRSYTSGGIDLGPGTMAPVIETGKIIAQNTRQPAGSSPVIAASYKDGEVLLTREDTGSRQAVSSPVSSQLKNTALNMLESDPTGWVIFSDMMKLRLRNYYYGTTASDYFINDAINSAAETLSAYGGTVYRIGDRADEVAMVLPGRLSSKEVNNILLEVQANLRERYDTMAFAQLTGELSAGALERLRSRQGVKTIQELERFVKGPSGKMIRAKVRGVLFENSDINIPADAALGRMLKDADIGGAIAQVESVLPPYLPCGATRSQTNGSAEERLEGGLIKAEQYQGIGKQRRAFTGVEGITRFRQRREIKNSLFQDSEQEKQVMDKLAGIEKSVTQPQQAELREFVRKLRGDSAAQAIKLDDHYAVFVRQNLHIILEYAMQLKATGVRTFMVRGPPDNFYIINTIEENGKTRWQAILVKQAVFTPDELIQKGLDKIMRSSRRGEQKGEYGFKVINDYEELFGHHVGNQLIALDSLYLYSSLQSLAQNKNSILNIEEISQALESAAQEINAITSGKIFTVDFEATVVSGDGFAPDFRPSEALELLEALSSARRSPKKTLPNIKSYNDNKDNLGAIADELADIEAYRAQRAGKDLAKETESFMRQWPIQQAAPTVSSPVDSSAEAWKRFGETLSQVKTGKPYVQTLTRKEQVAIDNQDEARAAAERLRQQMDKRGASSPVDAIGGRGLLQKAMAMKVVQAYLDGDKSVIYADIQAHNNSPGELSQYLNETIFPYLEPRLPQLNKAQLDIMLNMLLDLAMGVGGQSLKLDDAARKSIRRFSFGKLNELLNQKEREDFIEKKVIFKEGSTLVLEGQEFLIKKVIVKDKMATRAFYAEAVDTKTGDEVFLQFVDEAGNASFASRFPKTPSTYIDFLRKLNEEHIPGFQDLVSIAPYQDGQNKGWIVAHRFVKGRDLPVYINELSGKPLREYLPHYLGQIIKVGQSLLIMNEELGASHRDLYGRNIRVRQDDNTFVVIDFASCGESKETYDVGELAALLAGALAQRSVFENKDSSGLPQGWWAMPQGADIPRSLDATFTSYNVDTAGAPQLNRLIQIINAGLNRKLSLSGFVAELEGYRKLLPASASSPVENKKAALHFILEEASRRDYGGYSRKANSELETYIAAHNLLDPETAVTEQVIKDIHAIVSSEPTSKSGIIVEPVSSENRGVYRRAEISFGNMASTADAIPERMANFINWLALAEPESADPEQLSAKAFLKFINIHPFIDSNGRVGRFLINLLLLRNNRAPILTTYGFGFVPGSMSTYKREWLLANIIKDSQEEIEKDSQYQIPGGGQDNAASSPVVDQPVKAAYPWKKLYSFEELKAILSDPAVPRNAYRLSASVSAVSDNERQALSIYPSYKDINLSLGDMILQPPEHISGTTLSNIRNSSYMPWMELDDLIAEYGDYESTDYDGNLAKIVKNMGDKLVVHGIALNKGGIKGLLSIMLEGKIRQYSFDGGSYFDQIGKLAAAFGPYYVVIDKTAIERDGRLKSETSCTGDLEARYHNFYLVPNGKDREVLNAGIEEAQGAGLISEAAAGQIKSKIKTYDEIISSPGGIDFRSLPITTQPIPGTASLAGAQKVLAATVIPGINLNEQWQQIQNMLNSGIVPSSERIKEYAQACLGGKGADKDIDKVLSCIADILRLEEERVETTDPQLRELIILLESNKPANELQLTLANISFSPKEPALTEAP